MGCFSWGWLVVGFGTSSWRVFTSQASSLVWIATWVVLHVVRRVCRGHRDFLGCGADDAGNLVPPNDLFVAFPWVVFPTKTLGFSWCPTATKVVAVVTWVPVVR